MNKLTIIKKILGCFLLLAINSPLEIFGSAAESKLPLRTMPIMKAPGNAMPGWEKQIIELYHDEEGNPLPVVFRGAAKAWEAASWTPEYFAKQFGDVEIVVSPQNLEEEAEEELKEDLVCRGDKHCTSLCNKTSAICHNAIIPQDILESLNENSKDIEIVATYYKEDFDCNSNDERYISICDKSESICKARCYAYDEKSLTYYETKNHKNGMRAMHTTIRDHITDILLNPKNAGYLLCPLIRNATKNILDEILEDNDPRVKNLLFVYDYLNLETQTQFPQFIVKASEKESRGYLLFIGSENSVSGLHNHGSTFLSQIYGKKIARLVHPKYIEKCLCERINNDVDNIFVEKCPIDIASHDLDKYPNLKDIEAYQTILEPGDVLYIPEAWLHDIRALSTSISISSGF